MKVRHAQIIAYWKLLSYPTHSDYYSLVIKFNILSLSKFYFFFFGSVMFAGVKVIYKLHILIKLHRASGFFCIVQVMLT